MSNFPGGKKYGIAVKGPVACVDAPRRVYRSLLNIFSPWHQSHFYSNSIFLRGLFGCSFTALDV